MQTIVNPFKQALAERRPSVGLFLGAASPVVTEILAGCGYDWLLIDAEHGPNDPASVLPQLQAAAAYPVSLLVRPVSHDAALIKQYLGIGAQSLLMPMVDTAEQAQALVRAVRYPPRGVRGVGSTLERGARWGGLPGYHRRADEEIALVVQIESVAALENLESILAVDGIDAAFVGPADLAASMGYLGEAGHAQVMTTIEAAIGRIVATGKAAGVFATDPQAVRRYRRCGASFIGVGADTSLLRKAAASLLATQREALL